MSKKKIWVELIAPLTSLAEIVERKKTLDNDDNAGSWPQTQSLTPLIDEHRLIGKKNYNERTDDM